MLGTRHVGGMDNPLVLRQLANNRDTRGNWDAFSGHRARLGELIGSLRRSPADRLCVLGAGNCNDLDLPRLLDAFAELHLVDLDGSAMTDGTRRQGVAGAERLQLHRGVDVTGRLEEWAARVGSAAPPGGRPVEPPGTSGSLAGLAEVTEFDVVLSDCLLSQLVQSVLPSHASPDGQVEAIRRMRVEHLLLIRELLAIGGRAALVTDVVSTDTAPWLTREPVPPDWTEELGRLVDGRNFFTGTNPGTILRDLAEDAALAESITEPRFVSPWLWRLDSERAYLVYAIVFTRSA